MSERCVETFFTMNFNIQSRDANVENEIWRVRSTCILHSKANLTAEKYNNFSNFAVHAHKRRCIKRIQQRIEFA